MTVDEFESEKCQLERTIDRELHEVGGYPYAGLTDCVCGKQLVYSARVRKARL